MSRITISLPLPLKARAAKLAAERGVSLNRLLVDGLDRRARELAEGIEPGKLVPFVRPKSCTIDPPGSREKAEPIRAAPRQGARLFFRKAP